MVAPGDAVVDPVLEEALQTLTGGASRTAEQGALVNQASVVRRVVEALKALIGNQSPMATPVLLCSNPGRYFLRRWLEPIIPRMTILSPQEIPPEIRVRTLGTVR